MTYPRISPDLAVTYPLALQAIEQLDQSGEPCGVCGDETAVIEVQAYGRVLADHVHELGELDAYAESCADCLGQALVNGSFDPQHQVLIEFERANPVVVAP